MSILGLESHFDVGHIRVILGHADIKYLRLLLALEAVESGVNKGSCYLSRSVGAEVEENNAVAVLDGLGILAHARDDKLIRHAVRIGLLHHLCRVVEFRSVKARHGAVGLFDSVILALSVHGVIASLDGSYFAYAYLLHLLLKLLDEALAGGRGDIASVHKAVDKNFLYAEIPGHLNQRIEVGVVAVHAAV